MKEYQYLDKSYSTCLKRETAYTDMSVYCPHCGHTIVFVYVDRQICSHCGYWVYKDKKAEFMYKMKEKINKNGK